MTEAQAIEAISAQFAAQWPSASGGVPSALENEAMPSAAEFVYLTTKHSVSNPYTMGPPGTRREERRGFIFVKIWTPVDAGRNRFSTLADIARGIFNGQQLGGGEGVTVLPGVTQEAGPDGAWFIGAVVFPFRYYGTF